MTAKHYVYVYVSLKQHTFGFDYISSELYRKDKTFYFAAASISCVRCSRLTYQLTSVISMVVVLM